MMNSLRKWLLKPKRSDQCLLAKFYYADEELNTVASELDSFDGRKDTTRCNNLVMKLRNRQDSVLTIIEQIMREVTPNLRARRDYRIKFPEEVLQESLAGQLWFGAECLAAGSSIVNKEIESLTMRPLAKSFTKQLDELRSLLREQCFKNLFSFTPQIKDALVNFDQLFADFELSYVSAMVPVKSTRDYDALQDVTVLFCETVTRAMKSGLLNQDQFDAYDPVLMFTIPRLAIVCGLLIYPEGPLNPDQDPCQVSEMFRQQLTLLFKIRELLMTLSPQELNSLEKLICNPSGSHTLHLLENFPSNHSSGQHLDGDDDDDDLDDEEDIKEINNENDLSDKNLSTCNSWPQNGDSSLVEEPAQTANDERPNDLLLRRGISLVGPTRTEAVIHSVAWKGSNEFNFCLPRNTGRDGRRANVESASQDGVSNPGLLNGGEGHSADQNQPRSRRRNYCQSKKARNLSAQCRNHMNTAEGSSSEVLRIKKKAKSFTCQSFVQSIDNQGGADDDDDSTISRGREPKNFDEPSLTHDRLCSNFQRETKIRDLSDVSPQHLRSDGSSSSCDSMLYLEMENDTISKIIQMAKESAGMEARSKFKNSSDLVHQLFVCISKVADQLQTNFASDFRNILKATFESQSSSSSCRDPDDDPPPCLMNEEVRRVHGDGNDTDLTALDALEELINTTPTACQEPYLAPIWMPDESSLNCMSCKVPFTFLRRRHHCRNCGKIFCSQCSSNYVPLPHIGHLKPVRACNACYIFHIIPFTNS